MSLEIYPIKVAELCKIGKGREEPNVNPYLPPPVGRMAFSLNPFNLIVRILINNKLVSIYSTEIEKKNMFLCLLYLLCYLLDYYDTLYCFACYGRAV